MVIRENKGLSLEKVKFLRRETKFSSDKNLDFLRILFAALLE